LGADIDVIEDAVSGVALGAPGWSGQANIRVDSGSTRAIVAYNAPDSEACTLKVYTAAARIPGNQHADTAGAGSLDSRLGNTADGSERQFVLGRVASLEPGTQYHYALRCGQRLIVGQFRTRPAGTGVREFTLTLTDELAQDVVLEYDTDPLMSNPVTTEAVLFSAVDSVRRADLKLPVAAGEVIYARWQKRDSSGAVIATGPIKAYVLP
jgi:hypothetical protein